MPKFDLETNKVRDGLYIPKPSFFIWLRFLAIKANLATYLLCVLDTGFGELSQFDLRIVEPRKLLGTFGFAW